MPRYRTAYPPEFRRQMVDLVRSGRTPEELAREFEPSLLARPLGAATLPDLLARPLGTRPLPLTPRPTAAPHRDPRAGISGPVGVRRPANLNAPQRPAVARAAPIAKPAEREPRRSWARWWFGWRAAG